MILLGGIISEGVDFKALALAINHQSQGGIAHKTKSD